ncbi:LacI family DNA-binding transcriptional regulator [Corynebacterium timonense]|uniref:DNA-binding transcriptional regulator, LacI/PurR family n=1 Tax=Corynebacterium timonense TaxID=441500 RepID=A0A1H1L9L3_9CORY|nr:LacI family DNA-binding transcriptional regulator [Corynebacterium timonense]SDR70579.1 DNA-binding transcriptional regulator, LacI/PurR family [Corynebacterium timonense]
MSRRPAPGEYPRATPRAPAKTHPRATLDSIARELGVSRTTVSNAYNRPDQLSPELRQLILGTARELGYPGPNPTARSLRTARSGAVGVILTERLAYAFEDHASVDFLAGLAAANDVSLTLIPVGPGEGPSPNRDSVANAIVDGFVVYSVPAGDPHLKAARERGLPVVVCDQPATLSGVPYVGIDDAAAIEPAARSLVSAGHRRIGILTKRLFSRPRDGAVTRAELETSDMHVQRNRVRGALEVFRAAGIAEVPIVNRHFNDVASAADGARELIGAHPDLTAVLCTTDSMALGVLEAFGDRVPRDLSVTGFDGIAAARYLGLTTVEQPNTRKGREVGRVLRQLIDAPAAPPAPRTILPTQFVPGRTVSAPRERPRGL